MKRALIAVAVGSFGLAGCAYETGNPEAGEQAIESASQALCQGEIKPPREKLDNILAALATDVLKCKRSFTANDFFVDRATQTLQRRFECKDQTITRRIDNILRFQFVRLPKDETQPAEYFVAQWNKFLVAYKAAGAPTCPLWRPAQRINPPNKETVAAFVEGKGSDKTNYAWQLVPPLTCENKPGCATERAQLCSLWAGEALVVCTDPLKNGILTDPKWWWEEEEFDPSDNPFLSFGYEHEMAQWGYGPPGERWGAIQRAGEPCSKYDDFSMGILEPGMLWPVDCDGWPCVTQCLSLTAIPSSP